MIQLNNLQCNHALKFISVLQSLKIISKETSTKAGMEVLGAYINWCNGLSSSIVSAINSASMGPR